MKLIILTQDLSLIEQVISEIASWQKLSIINIYRSVNELDTAEDLRRADVLLMDCSIAETNGIHLAKDINWKHPELKIIGICEHYADITLSQLVECGIKACVLRAHIKNQLIHVLERTDKGRFCFPNEIKVDSAVRNSN